MHGDMVSTKLDKYIAYVTIEDSNSRVITLETIAEYYTIYIATVFRKRVYIYIYN